MAQGPTVKAFNSAKKFAEEVLHPLIKMHNDAKIRCRLGALSDEEALKLSPEIRVIKRFNAMKERISLLDALMVEVEPTIRLNNAKWEIELIEELKVQLYSIEENYEKQSHKIIEKRLRDGIEVNVLTELFKEIGQFLDRIYIQLQKLMTKNKLLFSGDDNEYLEDEELRERIKTENRSA